MAPGPRCWCEVPPLHPAPTPPPLRRTGGRALEVLPPLLGRIVGRARVVVGLVGGLTEGRLPDVVPGRTVGALLVGDRLVAVVGLVIPRGGETARVGRLDVVGRETAGRLPVEVRPDVPPLVMEPGRL